MICSICKKAEAVCYEYISHPDEPPRALCRACSPRNGAFEIFDHNDLYQHEAIRQLATEFKLQKMTVKEIREDEITYLLQAIETEDFNPNHYSPAKWVMSWFMFLRETGKYPEMLESPRKFVQHIISEYRYR